MLGEACGRLSGVRLLCGSRGAGRRGSGTGRAEVEMEARSWNGALYGCLRGGDCTLWLLTLDGGGAPCGWEACSMKFVNRG